MKNVSNKEIAKNSGVSEATVSRFFRNSSYVGDETRAKILNTMKLFQMDTTLYEAVSAPSRKLIIFNIPDKEIQFYDEVMQGASFMAEKEGYELLVSICSFKSDGGITDFANMLKKAQAAGLITTNHLSLEWTKKLGAVLPFVQCCECVKDSDVPFVTIDDIRAAENAVNFLISQGKRRIALLNGPEKYKYAEDRLQGYKNALKDAGLKFDASIATSVTGTDYKIALATALQMLNTADRPDAFFASNDTLAAAALKACLQTGLKVPEDVQIIGFDNSSFSEMCIPSLSTISQPKFQIGMMSCDLLLKMINGDTPQSTKLYLSTELILRETTSR